MIVRFAEAARHDLLEIEAWIAGENPLAAVNVVDDLLAACEGLREMPLRFAMDERFGLRRRPVGPYLIFYEVTDHVEIARILHGARDLGELLNELD